MNHPPSRTVLAASEEIRRLLDDAAVRACGMLPPVKSLARDLRVSVTTVVGAIAHLRDQGLLRPVRGKGVLLVPTERPRVRVPAPSRPLRWENVKAAILRDLASGALPSDRPLPSIKELQHCYGACHVTVKSALAALSRDLGLTRHKKTYALRVLRRTTSGRLAVIVPHLTPDARIEALQGFTYDFLRVMERRATQANLCIEVLPRAGVDARKLARDETLTGVCVHGWGVSGETAFAQSLASGGKPVALVDEVSDLTEGSGALLPGSTRVFLLGASDHGPRAVARHLAALGHRRVAFIAPWNAIHSPDGTAYVLTRAQHQYQRLCATFAAIDPASEVVPVTFDRLGEDAGEATAQSPELRRRFKLHRDGRYVAGRVDDLCETLSPAGQRAARRLSSLARSEAGALNPSDPIFEPYRLAAQRGDLTAWITAYDMYGFDALRYLRLTGVRVPRDRSLVSFDDLSIAMAGRFTSYNYNAEAAAAGVLDHLLHPDGRGSLYREKVVHVEGYLVERGTTGRAGS